MNMYSRVLKNTAVEVEPLLPRHRTGAAVTPPASAVSSGEVEQLRARLAEMAAKAEQQVRQAYDSGVRAGDGAARQELDGEVRQTVERLARAVTDVAQTRAETIRRAETDTVRLAMEIARRILHRELTTDTSALEALIRAALEKLQGQEVYRVRVHPDQENLMKSCLVQAGRGQSVAVVADPAQSKGGAVFEMSRGALDASVETQLREIERGLVDQLESRL